jgi:hypothetical protein
MREIPILAGRHPTFYADPTGEKRAEIFVVGERVIGDLADRYARPLIHLKRLAGCEWLKVTFAQTAGPAWTNQPAWIAPGRLQGDRLPQAGTRR